MWALPKNRRRGPWFGRGQCQGGVHEEWPHANVRFSCPLRWRVRRLSWRHPTELQSIHFRALWNKLFVQGHGHLVQRSNQRSLIYPQPSIARTHSSARVVRLISVASRFSPRVSQGSPDLVASVTQLPRFIAAPIVEAPRLPFPGPCLMWKRFG